MGKLKYSIVLASALAVCPLAAADAADLTPEPIPVPAPVPIPDRGAVYLKGFIGFSNQQADDFTNDIIQNGNFTIVSQEFDSAPFMGVGIGYQHGDRFRFDLTGEYRGRATFMGLDVNNSATTTNEYQGFKSEWLFLANAYWDFGNFRGVTPFVGVGIGVAEISLDNFQDVNHNTAGFHWADDGSDWNFAWALHAGFAYRISDDLTLDLAYRYVNVGDATTGNFQTYTAVASPGPFTIKDIDSHDLMLGLRWKLGRTACCEQTAYIPPVYK